MSSVSNKKVLVTGATGYVGSSLVKRMVEIGWDVHIVSRARSNMEPLESVESSIKDHKYTGTINSIFEIIKEVKPDIVFHLASLYLVEHESDNMEELILSNVLFPSFLLEAMVLNDVKFLINTGTAWQHHLNSTYNPVNLYAATKQAFEDILKYYVSSTSIKAITLKLFDTYGPLDPRKKLFNTLQQYSRTQEILAMSPGDQNIDLVYIDDVIDAYLRAAEIIEKNDEKNLIYAVSSGKPIKLKDLVCEYEKVSGYKINVAWGARNYRKREVMDPWRNGDLITGWSPKVNLEEGIKRILMGQLIK